MLAIPRLIIMWIFIDGDRKVDWDQFVKFFLKTSSGFQWPGSVRMICVGARLALGRLQFSGSIRMSRLEAG